jgi:hypothetical protein
MVGSAPWLAAHCRRLPPRARLLDATPRRPGQSPRAAALVWPGQPPYIRAMMLRPAPRRPFRSAAAALPLALLAACASPEAQLRDGLVKAGLSRAMASCMAAPMVDQLSLGQLMKLRSLSKVGTIDPRRTSYDQLMHRIRALHDPQILKVTTAAALGCALG